MDRPAPSVLYAVKQVELAIRARLDDLLRPHGITVNQYTALTVLDRAAGMTGAELARRSFVTPQSMGDLVGALEHRGLVAGAADPDHGRRRLLRATAAGRDLIRALDPDVDRLEDEMLAALSQGERVTFADHLNRARSALGADR